MRACRTLFTLIVIGGFWPTLSSATSTVREAPSDLSVCAVTAEFIEARRNAERIAWVFKRESSVNCPGLSPEFQVRIPGASFSTLSGEIVYPGYLQEISPGTRMKLRLNRLEKPVPGWYFAAQNPRTEVHPR